MAQYLVNQAKPHKVYIGGVDYTDQFVSLSLSDSSAFRQGIITTTGTLQLATTLNAGGLNDYDRDKFKRGQTVQVDLLYSNGFIERHPRGFLYVLATSWDPEAYTLNVEVGCELAMRRLTDEIEDLVSQAPIPLDPAQRTYEGLSSSLAADGAVMWCDRYGQLQIANFFNDTPGQTEAGYWTSVKGMTALSVKGLAGNKSIPDRIKLSYQFPEDVVGEDGTNRIDVVETESVYFLRYPAPTFKRVPNPGSNIGTIVTEPISVNPAPPPSGAPSGNVPPPPTTIGGGAITITIPPTACSSSYETVEDAVYMPADRYEVSTTTYGAPAAQVSVVNREMYGPQIEANSQYFADRFSYCRGIYASACNPMGDCPFDGMNRVLLARNVTLNTYGQANELT